jgi:ketosteroid isomerase-like protein
MNKTILLSIAIVLTTQLHAQNLPSKEEQSVHQAIIQLFEALSNRDEAGLRAYSTADITFYEYGEIWNIDTLIAKAITRNQSTDFKRTNSFEFINTRVDKTMAWATYWLQSVVFKDGKQVTVQWLETVVLVKEENQWKVKHLHSTLIKRR